MKHLATILLVLTVNLANAESLKIPVTQDNSIVMVDGEWELNGGSQGRIRIKANQHIVAMGFDLSAIRGKLVKKAELVCWQSEHTITGVTLSTIATPWSETKSNALTAGVENVVDWGYPSARFPAIAGGNAHTLVHHASSEIRDGKYYWDVAPDIVHAMAIGIAHGIAIHEHDADVGRNPTIFSREQNGKQPFLLVEIDDADERANVPEPPRNLEITRIDDCPAVVVSVGADAFAYEVLVDDQPLGRHNIPMASSDRPQTIHLRDLPSSIRTDVPHTVQVIALNRFGQRSTPAVVRDVIFETTKREKGPGTKNAKHPLGHRGFGSRPLSLAQSLDGLSVIPVLDKYDASGSPVGNLPKDYRNHNGIFDGSRVRLVAAAGEVVAFQLLLRGSQNVSLECDMAGMRVDLFQAKCLPCPAAGDPVRKIPEPLLPLNTTISLSQEADQAIVADIYVPFDATPGVKRGSVRISDGRLLPLEIEVLPVSIPRKCSFLCEMNGYGLPDHVDDYYALQRVAYDHRVHVNILHYSHHTAAAGARKSNLDMRLRSGKRMDNKRYDAIAPDAANAYWDDFVDAFDPYIRGTLFEDGHRGPIPAPAFYLTFHESWPLSCRPYFNGSPDAFQAFAESPEYPRTYDNILRDFRRRAHEQGWDETKFQVYFNNKGSIGELTKAPWILDEPASFWDYRALRYYGLLTHRSREVAPDVEVDFRIDISRPEFTRGQLDSKQDLWVVSSWAFENYRRLVTDRIALHDLEAWVYGTSNHVHESNRNTQAWALDAWQYGASGIVPWQTINKSGSAMEEPDQLGLFIFTQDAQGKTVVRHSLRLKAYREAEQLIEYLKLVKELKGWSMEDMRRFIAQYVDLDASVDKTNEADAGTSSYAAVSAVDLERLKQAAAELLRR